MSPRDLRARLKHRLIAEGRRAMLEARRRAAGSGDMYVDYGWIKLLYSGDGDEQEIYYHLYQNRYHEKDMTIFRSLLAPGQTAVDVGANLGFVTTMLASIVGPRGRVLSFEPSPKIFAKLLRTIDANALTQVIPLNVGCGDRPSSQRLKSVNRNSGESSIIADGVTNGPVTDIEVIPLDQVEVAWQTPIKLLKIDTEGYEPMVLRGASRLIAEHRPTILIEMGGAYVASTLESIAWLEEAGYDVAHVRDVDWSHVGNGNDYFFLPRSA
jgi:FkbM family methyltransferase